MDHFSFYTTHFLIFLERSLQLDLTSSTGVMLLFRVAKVQYIVIELLVVLYPTGFLFLSQVFSQPGLGEFIRYGISYTFTLHM